MEIKAVLLSDSVQVYKGKYLKFPCGSLTSIPESDEKERVVVRSGDGEFYINSDSKGYYMQGNKYDKRFKTLEELAKYLDKEKAVYVGID